jgi:hypothetical protein
MSYHAKDCLAHEVMNECSCGYQEVMEELNAIEEQEILASIMADEEIFGV